MEPNFLIISNCPVCGITLIPEENPNHYYCKKCLSNFSVEENILREHSIFSYKRAWQISKNKELVEIPIAVYKEKLKQLESENETELKRFKNYNKRRYKCPICGKYLKPSSINHFECSRCAGGGFSIKGGMILRNSFWGISIKRVWKIVNENLYEEIPSIPYSETEKRKEEERLSKIKKAWFEQSGYSQNNKDYNNKHYKSHYNSSKRKSNEEEKAENKYSEPENIPKNEKYYYKILELDGNITIKEIKSAYIRLIAKYHPDKVQHLGSEFQEIADRKTREINEAYKYFKDKYKF